MISMVKKPEWSITRKNICYEGLFGHKATCIFIARKVLGYEGVVKAMQILDNYLKVTPMDGIQCHNALFSSMPDFEDMLQFESAYAAGCDVIVTRNKKHFPQDAIQILDSTEFFECYWFEEG